METKSSNDKEITHQAPVVNTGQTKSLPVRAINEAEAKPLIHFKGDTTFYSLSEHEFMTIKNGTDNIWKEICIATWGLFIPLAINSFVEFLKLSEGNFSSELFFNLVFTLVTLIVAIGSTISFLKSENHVKKVIKKVESKPKFQL